MTMDPTTITPANPTRGVRLRWKLLRRKNQPPPSSEAAINAQEQQQPSPLQLNQPKVGEKLSRRWTAQLSQLIFRKSNLQFSTSYVISERIIGAFLSSLIVSCIKCLLNWVSQFCCIWSKYTCYSVYIHYLEICIQNAIKLAIVHSFNSINIDYKCIMW